MPDPAMLDYFYGDEAEQYTFYRIPKVLFTDPAYRRISSDAKILYGLMLDRMGLSVRNGIKRWIEVEGSNSSHAGRINRVIYSRAYDMLKKPGLLIVRMIKCFV